MNLLKNRRERLASERENAEMARLALVETLMVPAPQPTEQQAEELDVLCGSVKEALQEPSNA